MIRGEASQTDGALQRYKNVVREQRKKIQKLEKTNGELRDNIEDVLHGERVQERVQLLLDEISTMQQVNQKMETDHKLELEQCRALHKDSEEKKQSVIEKQKMLNEILASDLKKQHEQIQLLKSNKADSNEVVAVTKQMDTLKSELICKERVIKVSAHIIGRQKAMVKKLHKEIEISKTKVSESVECDAVTISAETATMKEHFVEFYESMQGLLERHKSAEQREHEQFLRVFEETLNQMGSKCQSEKAQEKAEEEEKNKVDPQTELGNYKIIPRLKTIQENSSEVQREKKWKISLRNRWLFLCILVVLGMTGYAVHNKQIIDISGTLAGYIGASPGVVEVEAAGISWLQSIGNLIFGGFAAWGSWLFISVLLG